MFGSVFSENSQNCYFSKHLWFYGNIDFFKKKKKKIITKNYDQTRPHKEGSKISWIIILYFDFLYIRDN